MYSTYFHGDFSLQNVPYWPLANLVFTTPCELGVMISVLTMRN